MNKEFQQGCQEYRENWWPVQVRKFLPPSKSMIAQSFPRQRRRIPGKVPFYFRFVSKAYEGITRGNDIYFRPGVYDPSTIKGLAKLGHELVHVGQYRNGMTWAQYWWASRHEYDPNNQYEKPAYDKQDAIENTMTKEKCGGCPKQ